MQKTDYWLGADEGLILVILKIYSQWTTLRHHHASKRRLQFSEEYILDF
jgi:hypothetical protein